MTHAKPAILIITLLLLAITFVINNTIRPLFNECVRRYNHHCMIEARRKEFYSGLSTLMNSERKSGLL